MIFGLIVSSCFLSSRTWLVPYNTRKSRNILFVEPIRSGVRFWSETISVNTNDSIVGQDALLTLIASSAREKGIQLKQIDSGILLFPSIGRLVPISQGQFQPQHTLTFASPSDWNDGHTAIVCSFSRRATHSLNAFPGMESETIHERSEVGDAVGGRPLNEERLEALTRVLRDVHNISISKFI
jgi:hypothetical protein